MKSSTALWYEAQQKLTLRTELLCPVTDREVALEALWTGVSLGTERLVFKGKIPHSEWQRMSCPYQQGSFGLPVKYGYGFVGRIVDPDGQKSGKNVFCLHPHQSHAVVDADAVHDLPGDVPAKRAILAANMETALNIVWDSRVSLGDRVLVVGAGVIGLLVTWLLSRIPGVDATVCDIDAGKRRIAETMKLKACSPADCPIGCDVAVNASASQAGLHIALDAAGPEARIVEASWFGDQDVTLPLGGAFHSQRLQIVSSQVGRVPADRRARWSTRRRMAMAIAFLADPALDLLISHEIDFEAAPEELPPLFDDPAALAIALRYPAAPEPG